ncbi:hypothetical protein AB0B39_23545 [Micromonospora sp. NPDC049114]|uniref:hypothetical protein n=1 Tax=Micromonospora sp. NPDC049114 TaxID=3155498 RepID=UPI0033FFF221
MNDNTPNSTTADAFDATQAGEPDNLLDLLAATPPAVEEDSGDADEDTPPAPVNIAERQAQMATDLYEMLHQINGVEIKPAPRHLAIEEQFMDFHRGNPGVYVAVRTLSYQRHRMGKTRLSMGWAFEYLRDVSFVTTGSPWLLDNNFKPGFVRLLEFHEVPLRGLFEKRPSWADEWIVRYAAEQTGQGEQTGRAA